MVVVERHYLRTTGGGFTESYYGLKRERVLRIKGGELPRTQIVTPTQLRESLKLSEGDIWKNIAVMVGLPYLKRKLDESYEIYAPQTTLLGPRYNQDSLAPDATFRQRVMYYYKWFLRNVYPSINGAYYFSILVFNLAYLSNSTMYSSPFLWLIQTRFRRMSSADHRAMDLAQQKPSSPPAAALRPGHNSSIFNTRTFSKVILPKLLSGLKLALPTSIFLLKFLEWWHASDFARKLSRKAAEDLQLPPPVIAGLHLGKKSSTEATATTNSVSLGKAAGTTTLPTSTATKVQQPKAKPPISSSSHLPILTVPAPISATSGLCPICLKSIVTPTATQTGYVFCYTCIFRWVEGTHDRQTNWMEGSESEEVWGNEDVPEEGKNYTKTSREGSWESGKGRCAITGRRLLGGTDGLRRIIA